MNSIFSFAAATLALGSLVTADVRGFASIDGSGEVPPSTLTITVEGETDLRDTPTEHIYFRADASGYPGVVMGVDVLRNTTGGLLFVMALSPTATVDIYDGMFTGTGPSGLTVPEKKAYLDEEYVFEVQTGGGLIHGEIELLTHSSCKGGGTQVAPPVPTSGKLEGSLEWDQGTDTASYSIEVSATLGIPTAAHIRLGPPGINGPIVATLSQVAPSSWSGVSGQLSFQDKLAYFNQRLYVEVETSAFPAGEVRGQIRPGPFNSSTDQLAELNGGVQLLSLDTGPNLAGHIYITIGSLSGTSPGFPFGGETVPLNIDAYTMYLIQAPGNGILGNQIGLLDAMGHADVTFVLPPATGLLIGLHFDHAFLAFDPGSAAVSVVSNAKGCTLIL